MATVALPIAAFEGCSTKPVQPTGAAGNMAQWVRERATGRRSGGRARTTGSGGGGVLPASSMPGPARRR